MARTGIGVVGVGDISGAYLHTFRQFDSLEVVACAALHLERAQARWEAFHVGTQLLVRDAGPGCAIGELTFPTTSDDVERILEILPGLVTRVRGVAIGPAEKAGLKVGDVITQFEGQPVGGGWQLKLAVGVRCQYIPL